MTVIVTGASGFLGLATCRRLLSEGHTVYGVLQTQSQNAHKLPKHDRFFPVRYDLGSDDTALKAAVQHADVFIHFAWAATKSADRNDHDAHFANVDHSLALMKTAAALGCRRFIFAGSQAEYGIHFEQITEDTPCNPMSEYGKAKLAFGLQGAALAPSLGLDFIHLRIFSTYGVGDHPHTLMSSCIRTFSAGDVMQMGDCMHTWNFLYIDDEAALITKMAAYNGTLSAEGNVFNVASDDTRRLKEFVLEAYDLCGKQGECAFGEPTPKPEGIVQLNPSIAKAKRLLDWAPRVSFAEGVKRMIAAENALKTPPRYPYVLFDLDGTLADTGEGVMNSAKHACKTLGYPEPPQAKLDKIIGPPLGYSFPHYLGVKEEDTLDAIRIFRERYAVKGLLECRIYDGISDLLGRLRAAGCRLFVATCKPTAYSETILKNLGVAHHFDLIVGSNLDNTRAEKVEVLDYLCKTAAIAPEQCVMIGDRYSDVRGAKAFSMDSVGVTFGYGSREELEAEAATFVADSPADIEKFILG